MQSVGALPDSDCLAVGISVTDSPLGNSWSLRCSTPAVISRYFMCVSHVAGLPILEQSIASLPSASSNRLPSGPKKWYPCFNFAITSVNVHRF